jgi:hypothetical protein
MMVVKCQRKRVRFSKITHLQDEDGDTLQLPHPFSGEAMTVFVTDLTRRIKIAESPDGDGYMIDDIEGWKL